MYLIQKFLCQATVNLSWLYKFSSYNQLFSHTLVILEQFFCSFFCGWVFLLLLKVTSRAVWPEKQKKKFSLFLVQDNTCYQLRRVFNSSLVPTWNLNYSVKKPVARATRLFIQLNTWALTLDVLVAHFWTLQVHQLSYIGAEEWGIHLTAPWLEPDSLSDRKFHDSIPF